MDKKVLIGLWGLIALTVICTWLTPLEFTNKYIFVTSELIMFAGLPIILWLTHVDKERKSFWATSSLLSFIGAIVVLVVVDFFTWAGPWKTQSIEWRKINNPNVRIEFQMSDLGAFGYSDRYVEITPVAPFLHWVEVLTKIDMDPKVWEKVDVYVNGMEFKGG